MDNLLLSRGSTTSSILMKSHFHDFYEIYYLVEGNMRYIIADDFYEISKNDVVLIPRGVIHNTSYGDGGTKRLLINFSESFISEPSLLSVFDKKIVKLSERDGFALESIFKDLEAEQARNDKYSKTLISQYLNELFILLSRSEIKNISPELDGYTQIMQAAVKYINSNYSRELALCDLSLKFGLSKSFFSRKFKQITGFGMAEYITLVRIKNAEKMLLEGKHSVTDVAFSCGFNDCSYFAATFKRIMGITPHRFSAEKPK